MFAFLSIQVAQAQGKFVPAPEKAGYYVLEKYTSNRTEVYFRNPIKKKDGTQMKIYGLGDSCFRAHPTIYEVIFDDDQYKEEIFLGTECFAECPELATVELPSSVKVLPEGCFRNDKNLQKMRLPDSLMCILPGAFDGCDYLNTLQIWSKTPKKLSAFNFVFNGILVIPDGTGELYTDPSMGWTKHFKHIRQESDDKDYVRGQQKAKPQQPQQAQVTPYMKFLDIKVDYQGNHYKLVKARELLVVAVVETNIPEDAWVNIHFKLANGSDFHSVNPAYNTKKGVVTSERIWDYQGTKRKVVFRVPYKWIYGNYGAKSFKFWLTTSTVYKHPEAKMDKSETYNLTVTNVPQPRK
jgi:hypothetical protein